MNENQVNGQQFQVEKPKKPWYKKWWVWGIAAVVLIMIVSNSSSEDQKGSPASTTTTTQSQQEASPTNKPKDEPKAKTIPTAQPEKKQSTNEVFNIYYALQKNELFPYEMSEKSQTFIKSNPALFPATSKDAIASFVDDTIEYKHLNKNVSNYGDKLIYLPEAYVVGIEEEDMGGKKLSSIHVMDEMENSYQIIYLGSLNDVFEEDVVTVYGLPIGMSGFQNVSGGTTLAAVIAGSYIKKL